MNSILYFLVFTTATILEKDQKDKVATTITSLIRENFLMTDFRAVSKDLEKIRSDNFIKIIVKDKEGKVVVESGGDESYLNLQIKKLIGTDKALIHPKGEIYFFWNIDYLIWLSFKILFASMLITLPIFLVAINFFKKRQKQIIENEKVKIMVKLSRQMSHDIRSPIAALQQISKNNNTISKGELIILKAALERIDNIANTHLEDYRSESVHLQIIDIQDIIKEIVNEKKIEFPDLEINLHIQNFKINCVPDDLKRIISNLINNSYEAMNSRNKTIEISTDKSSEIGFLRIEDFGIGIPGFVLDQFGKYEITSKKSGNGLGVLHASETLKRWQAYLKIIKTDSSGTILEISFPSTKDEFILIDNDELTRLTWSARAKKGNVNFKSYASYVDFENSINDLSTDAVIYIDSDLGEGIRGEEIAQILHAKGFKNISLATGFSDEKFIELNFLRSVISKTPPF